MAVADPRLTRPSVLRIASYNIHRAIGRDRSCSPERIAAVIRELACDTVGLQEVSNRPNGGPKAMQMDFIAREVGMAAVAGVQTALYGGEYGSGLLTIRPVINVAHHDLSMSRREPRSLLDVEIDVDGLPVRVLLAHLGLGLFERRGQVRRILRVVSSIPADRPVILLGDINEWLPRGPLAWLHAEFGAPPAPRSFPARFPLVAFDRVWVRPRAALTSIAVHRSPTARMASDHLPVVATASLTGSRSLRGPAILPAMGISYRIDMARRRVYVVGSGKITAAQMFETQQRLTNDPSFQPTFSQLFDLSEAETVEISSNQMSALAERTAFSRGARRAIVVNRPLLFGLARMFGLIADAKGGDLELFSDRTTAEQWLDGGLASPAPRPDEAVEEQ